MAVKKIPKGQGYECRTCGYRVVIDSVCGCGEEHILICCGKPMKQAAAKKPAAKKKATEK